jgi:hypothetical protein
MDNSLILWVAGTSVGGFLFLAGWCWNLHEKYNAIAATAQKVNEIHAALIGDMEREGLLSKTRRMEEQCKIRHSQGALA